MTGLGETSEVTKLNNKQKWNQMAGIRHSKPNRQILFNHCVGKERYTGVIPKEGVGKAKPTQVPSSVQLGKARIPVSPHLGHPDFEIIFNVL